MAYGDLIKLDGREILTEINPCRRGYGPGPEGAKCKTCVHLVSLQYANTYHKCDLRQNTHGPGTDHRLNWKACAKYQTKVNGRERNTR